MQKSAGRARSLLALLCAAVAAFALMGLSSTTAAHADTTQTLWGSSSPAGVGTADDNGSVELGTAFGVTQDGAITGVRYWRPSAGVATSGGALWTSGGKLVASVTSTVSSQTGWQTATFASPVKVQAGESYVVSYHAPQGRYAFSTEYHGSDVSADLTIATSNAGRYAYSSSTKFPTDTYRSTNYWVTPVFTASAGTASGGAAPSTPTPTASAPTTSAPTTSTKPGPSNTGVPSGVTLTAYTGPHTITTPGTVIEAKDVTGGLVIQAKNVTIRNSKIHDDPDAVAGVFVDGGSATIINSEIYNVQVGITYSNWTAIGVDIHDTTFDGTKISSNVRLQDSWIHDPKPSSDSHWDGGQVQNGVTNTVIQGNVIDATGGDANSALFLTPDLGPSTVGPLTVTGNWLDGGNYTVFILDGDNGRYFISNIIVTNNRFGRGGYYGPSNVNVPVTWSGNVWDDTGKVVDV